MKIKGLLPYLFMFGMILLISSCGDDDDSTNSYSYDGTTYNITNAFLDDIGGNFAGSHDYDIYLAGDGISAGNSILNGTGDFLYLDLNTAANNGLEPGTYSWSSTRDAQTIVSGSSIATNFNTSTLSGNLIALTGGTVVISQNGDEFTFDINLEASGTMVTGSYTGSVEEF